MGEAVGVVNLTLPLLDGGVRLTGVVTVLAIGVTGLAVGATGVTGFAGVVDLASEAEVALAVAEATALARAGVAVLVAGEAALTAGVETLVAGVTVFVLVVAAALERGVAAFAGVAAAAAAAAAVTVGLGGRERFGGLSPMDLIYRIFEVAGGFGPGGSPEAVLTTGQDLHSSLNRSRFSWRSSCRRGG